MSPSRRFLTATLILMLGGVIFSAAGQSSNGVSSSPIYVPDTSHANDIMTNGILAWDEEQKTVEATNGEATAIFSFNFTNVSTSPITILNGRGSCSCTTVQMPATPWLIPAGGTGQIGATIDLAGKEGMLFKFVIIATDRGVKNLMLRVEIQPPPVKVLTDEERAHGMAAAKIDRQAVFKGECATCHVNNIAGKSGQQLFASLCTICHEASPRASMVPDLHNLKELTSEEFWRAWITAGKPGTLMPAFSTAEGGPLDNAQIENLASYLSYTIPAHITRPETK